FGCCQIALVYSAMFWSRRTSGPSVSVAGSRLPAAAGAAPREQDNTSSGRMIPRAATATDRAECGPDNVHRLCAPDALLGQPAHTSASSAVTVSHLSLLRGAAKNKGLLGDLDGTGGVVLPWHAMAGQELAALRQHRARSAPAPP